MHARRASAPRHQRGSGLLERPDTKPGGCGVQLVEGERTTSRHLETAAQCGGLGAELVVGVEDDGDAAPRGVCARRELTAAAPQARGEGAEVVEVALLARARAARGLPVGDRSSCFSI